MKITIRARKLELSDAVRDQMIRRTRFALARLSLAVRAVEITLADVNGPRGGADKLCRVRVRGPRLRPIVIEQAGADPLATVSEAVDRAARTTLRELDRRRLFTAPLAVSY